MYKSTATLLEGFSKLELDDREVEIMKKFIRNDSAGGFHDNQVINNYKSLETGQRIALPVFDVLRKGPFEHVTNPDGEPRTIGKYRKGNEWEGFEALTKRQQVLLFDVVRNISHHTAPFREMGGRLKEVRADSGYGQTLQKFADFLSDDQLKVTRSTIRDLEFGARQIPDKILFALHLKCKINRDWILHGRGAKKSNSESSSDDLTFSLENRIQQLERQLSDYVGVVEMQRDGKVNFDIPRGSNYELRQDLDKLQEEVRDLRASQRQIGDNQSLIMEKLDIVSAGVKDMREGTDRVTDTLQRVEERIDLDKKQREEMLEELKKNRKGG